MQQTEPKPVPADPAPVVFCLPCGLVGGGVTTWALRLARGLSERGHTVALIAHPEPPHHRPLPDALDPRIEVVRPDGSAPLDRCAGDYAPYMGAYRETIERLHESKARPPVVIPTISAECLGILAALCQTHAEALRVLSWTHNHIEHDLRMAQCYEPIIARFAGVSRAITDDLRRALAWRASDIEWVPNGIEVSNASPQKRPPLGDRPLRLIYTGRMDRTQKRVTALLEMSRVLEEMGIRHELTLVGDGPEAATIDRCGLPHVRRLCAPDGGPITSTEVGPLLRGADAFVLCSRHEGMCLSMLEAMAAGCVPVVTRVTSGLEEVVTDAEQGLIVEPEGDDDESVGAAMAEGVRRFIGSDRETLARNAWRRVGERFSLGRQIRAASRAIQAASDSAPRHWPASRACSSVSRDADGGDFSVPADAARRMRRVLGTLPGRRVAIWGAGRHTVALASVIGEHSDRVCAIVDDDAARAGKRLWGYTILTPEDVPSAGVTDVVISSWMHEERIWRRRAALERRGVRVHRLYSATESPTLVA